MYSSTSRHGANVDLGPYRHDLPTQKAHGLMKSLQSTKRTHFDARCEDTQRALDIAQHGEFHNARPCGAGKSSSLTLVPAILKRVVHIAKYNEESDYGRLRNRLTGVGLEPSGLYVLRKIHPYIFKHDTTSQNLDTMSTDLLLEGGMVPRPPGRGPTIDWKRIL